MPKYTEISTNRLAFCELSLRYELVHFPGGVLLKQENVFTATTNSLLYPEGINRPGLRNEDIDIGGVKNQKALNQVIAQGY
jgi:hypothetical protein